MVKSKGWNWKIVPEEQEKIWKNPCMESYYLVNRWKSQNKKDFLDLGCGLGRHSILFGNNGFNVSCFDISPEAIKNTKEWAEREGLTFDYQLGDMLSLPYKDDSFDCILCRNVISHTDTEGVKKIASELRRVLKNNGECYFTLGSKESWGFQQKDWPLADENTRIRMEEGHEYGIPHFFADYDLIQDLFKDFNIIDVHQEVVYYKKHGKRVESHHYHVLIKKGK